MRSIFKSKKICFIIVSLILIYTFISFISQEKKLKNYEQQKQYYQAQIENLQDEQADLLQEQENIDSPDYIEEQAREKLDMYYPSERVYIAQ
ncbi:MAG: cell division protein FtsL [Clostridia bacterium]|nr:cell division protein FtsL [Clostridia bacterium]